jgi:hypothetical protein
VLALATIALVIATAARSALPVGRIAAAIWHMLAGQR